RGDGTADETTAGEGTRPYARAADPRHAERARCRIYAAETGAAKRATAAEAYAASGKAHSADPSRKAAMAAKASDVPAKTSAAPAPAATATATAGGRFEREKLGMFPEWGRPRSLPLSWFSDDQRRPLTAPRP